MSEKVTGQVGLVFEKKLGNNVLYSIKLENDDNWYRTGKIKPEGIQKDDFVEFTYDIQRGQKAVNLSSLKKITPPRLDSGSATNGQTSGGGVIGTDGITLKDLRISIGYAREQAIKVTDMLLSNEALVLPSAKTKVAERNTAVLGFIDNLTRQYFAEGVAISVADYEQAMEFAAANSADDPMDLYGDDAETGDD